MEPEAAGAGQAIGMPDSLAGEQRRSRRPSHPHIARAILSAEAFEPPGVKRRNRHDVPAPALPARPGQNTGQVMKRPAVSSGFCEADERAKTVDLLAWQAVPTANTRDERTATHDSLGRVATGLRCLSPSVHAGAGTGRLGTFGA